LSMSVGNIFRGWVVGAVALVASMGLSPASGQSGGGAADRIGTLYGGLIETMQQANQLGIKGRSDRLAPVLVVLYHGPARCRVAEGQGWATLARAQQGSIIEAFTRMMIANYANQFDGFSGERFEVLQTIDKGAADKLVKTRLVQSNGKTVALDYLMRNDNGTW